FKYPVPPKIDKYHTPQTIHSHPFCPTTSGPVLTTSPNPRKKEREKKKMKLTTPQTILLLSTLFTSQTLALPTTSSESRPLTQSQYFPDDPTTPLAKTLAPKRDIFTDIRDKIVDTFSSFRDGDGSDTDDENDDERNANARRSIQSLTEKISKAAEEAARIAEAEARSRTNSQQDRPEGRRRLAVRQEVTVTTTSTTSVVPDATESAAPKLVVKPIEDDGEVEDPGLVARQVEETVTSTATTTVVPEATGTPDPKPLLVVKPIEDEEPLTPEEEAALGAAVPI
ncbi:hypothetical protein QBC44DRAFT_392410, partial [Cladorrhinum sp. PSN332]